jgi:hypothetical protein
MTGILSMFAARAGARLAIGVDASDIIEQARAVVAHNQLADRVQLHHSSLEARSSRDRAEIEPRSSRDRAEIARGCSWATRRGVRGGVERVDIVREG